jgi:hypothetical protein
MLESCDNRTVRILGVRWRSLPADTVSGLNTQEPHKRFCQPIDKLPRQLSEMRIKLPIFTHSERRKSFSMNMFKGHSLGAVTKPMDIEGLGTRDRVVPFSRKATYKQHRAKLCHQQQPDNDNSWMCGLHLLRMNVES